MIPLPLTLSLLLAVPDGGLPSPLHGGLLAEAGGTLELVVGPERVALFSSQPLADEAKVTLSSADGEPLALEAVGDHFEAPNAFGVERPLQLVAVVQDHLGARVARFDFVPGQGSTFHDHRPFHGGYVGMVGDRHIEIVLVPAGEQSEIQLYLSDAYRQPLSPEGARAELTFPHGTPLALHPLAGSLVGRVPRPKGALDTHVALTFPGEQEPVEMDFYLDPQTAAPPPAGSVVQVRVSDSGFTPSRITVEAGKPMTLRFLRTSANTCAKEVVFPEQAITRELPLGKPVEVALIPHKGEIAFSCGMRMFKGQIVAR
jgi:hypothetical protein